MDKLELITTAKRDGDSATLHIINRHTDYQPFVVCWNFNGSEWDWGTYCENLSEAFAVFGEKRRQHGFVKGVNNDDFFTKHAK